VGFDEKEQVYSLTEETNKFAAVLGSPGARDVLDIGCGAGNYTLKVLEKFASGGMPAVNCTLVDLSLPMLERARERVSAKTSGSVRILQGDMRELAFGEKAFDVIVSSAALHHLRTDAEWEGMYGKIFAALKPGGSFWIFDMVEHVHPPIETMMRGRYGDYLVQLKGGGEAGRAYREHVFAYVAQEDTPRPLMYQLGLMQKVGFRDIDVLHKTVLFAAFGGRKASSS